MRNPHNETLNRQHRSEPRDPASARDAGRKGASARRGQDAADADGPVRKCILSGEHDSRERLIRLAISPDGVVLPDVLARAPGRGAWIGVSRGELETAMAKGRLKGALARAFKGATLHIPDDLPERIAAALLRALSDRLGIELRCGTIVLGTEKIAVAARSGAVRLLAHASDARDDGMGKLAQAWRVGEEAEGSGMKGMILPLDRAALSVALGRDNVVHLALTDVAAAGRVMTLAKRCSQYFGCAIEDEGACVSADGGAHDADDMNMKGSTVR